MSQPITLAADLYTKAQALQNEASELSSRSSQLFNVAGELKRLALALTLALDTNQTIKADTND